MLLQDVYFHLQNNETDKYRKTNVSICPQKSDTSHHFEYYTEHFEAFQNLILQVFHPRYTQSS